jgi:undecaprenyl-phosphate galactose phosphotransferase/putative colanic acid biosynthesis UDP-glucose lipid carrier transferase
MSILKKLSGLRLSRYFKLFFVVWDIIVLNIAITFGMLLRDGSLLRFDLKEVQIMALVTNFLWVAILLNKEGSAIVRVERIDNIVLRMIRQLSILLALNSLIIILLRLNEVLEVRTFYFYAIFFILLSISRFLFMKILKYVRAKGYNFKTVIIIGANDTGEKMQKILAKDITYGYRILGFFDDKAAPDDLNSLPLLGGFAAIENYVKKIKVDEMFIALRIDNIEVIKQLTLLCERNMIRVKFVPDFQQYTGSRKVEIRFYENTPVLILRKEPLEGTVNILLKRVFDIVFSFLVIVLVFPFLFPVIFLLIKMDSPGPVLFKQQRSGRENRPFSCFKFRTMHENTISDTLQASKGDSRITKVGAFMRRTNIDEFPQFFNVFFGTMTVAGPRPHMLSQTDKYSELINNYLVRHYAKPGITGWAQVNGFRGETKKLLEMKERVEHDIWYIENWSLLLDLKIIFRTILNVIKGEENAC